MTGWRSTAGRAGTCRSSRCLRPSLTWRSGRRRSSTPNSAADMLLCDTGVLLAAGNVKDQAHQACLKLLRQVEGPLLVPSPVLGEIGYLLQSRVGPQAEVTFLKSFGGDGFHIAELEDQDIQHMAGLVETTSISRSASESHAGNAPPQHLWSRSASSGPGGTLSRLRPAR